ncbi:hypothetical protein FRC09_012594 [Ceratobasidium sp. 395]|nr:hypothetical protein FRC09_012594 [Ceratobasidium sp. 395]
MRLSFVIASFVLLVSTTSATFSPACPPFWILVPEGDQCVCKHLFKTEPPKAGCKTYITTILGIKKKCKATCSDWPAPSPRPYKPKRNEPMLLKDGTPSLCPVDMSVCPLAAAPHVMDSERATATIPTKDSYECVKPEEDLYNCGGCSSTGQGVNCNTITGVLGTSCIKGKCVVYTCQKGYKFTTNKNGAQECVRKSLRHMSSVPH